mmetsp:Transcript_26247/g.43506  ORF Transcript_26247/g.43506 Transcript_26247/m.43506 type:complete len:350 (-) Transcript_26247:278-1327(-)|eukprot:CAMPEP_0119321082 /NCGR_PEP_ID=MMETSP1333-20130426/54343_1 /TAXON_ID=418940 /ORGANISM="Scyphosphaera apsteinii, Strain RCC1455" /LENGTH=349 /DNA_ID=CAMNT_0007327955 /DNA_START=161 /DNA_END=1210 /DNA_ORIENTATION=+
MIPIDGCETGPGTSGQNCRFCFEGEENGELMAPCNCCGDQKYVHIACLERWQQAVSKNSSRSDQRHNICNVCRKPFRRRVVEIKRPPHADSGCVVPLALISCGVNCSRDAKMMEVMFKEMWEDLGVSKKQTENIKRIEAVYLITHTNDDAVRKNFVMGLLMSSELKDAKYQQAEAALKKICSIDLPDIKLRHFIGGPHDSDRPTFMAMIRGGSDGKEIAHGDPPLWVQSSLHSVCNAAREDSLLTHQEAEVLVFWGHARWTRSNLDTEVKRGLWQVVDGRQFFQSMEAQLDIGSTALWQRLVVYGSLLEMENKRSKHHPSAGQLGADKYTVKPRSVLQGKWLNRRMRCL